jgi:rare lipoprotein A
MVPAEIAPGKAPPVFRVEALAPQSSPERTCPATPRRPSPHACRNMCRFIAVGEYGGIHPNTLWSYSPHSGDSSINHVELQPEMNYRVCRPVTISTYINTKVSRILTPPSLAALTILAAICSPTASFAGKAPFTPSLPSSWQEAGKKAEPSKPAAKLSARRTKRAAGKEGRPVRSSRRKERAVSRHATRNHAAPAKRRPSAARSRQAAAGWESCGRASWYAMGSRTANGERFAPSGLTAAHRTMPFGTRLVVTEVSSKRSVTVRVNDRGPFIPGRILDLSRGAAQSLGVVDRGVADICMKVTG